jgi:hypothetical protein
MMETDQPRRSFAEVIAMVAELADQADAIAAGLRQLREPAAARLVEVLADEADQAVAALRLLVEPLPGCTTNWYQVHRDRWIRDGDPGDLVAMTEKVAEALAE